ncbi:thioesterase [Insulibacter thermoxylanivorax]|uniref:Thioesterase n=1 Tax=Insulibacter thermoxylanivorax TaxID=2749268 RepID=A0A916VFP2_9BACL|nr:DRTGG domain-containing protein [Insulibacter thermoxylanivorax]GFR38093.1 thioesterase [Insulibacter thermoxylanivorax]
MIKDEHSREQGRTASDKSELGAGGNSKVGTTGHADPGEIEPLTKHEYILRHLISLKPGSKISVRKIARELEVSEGTAYRAIKEAENLGIVATKERTGTVRIEKRERQLDHLTFAEVAEMVNGRVLGGAKGLDKQLQKFVIGAMELDAMVRHIEAQSLLIVGNRYRAHIRALQQGAGVLITGGFDASEEAKKLADELCLPIISCEWDTFTVASTINRAIYDHNIKRKIVLVEDIVSLNSRVISLKANNTLGDMRRLMEETGLRQFPVVDDWNRLIGVITSKDIQGEEDACQVDKLMTRNPITANLQTSAASAAHMMVWEGIDLLPIVDVNRKLIAVLYRQDVMEAIRYTRKQPQGGETIEDQILSEFEEIRDPKGQLMFRGTITPLMTNNMGTVSEGVMATLMMKAAYRAVKDLKNSDLVLDNITTHYLRPVQMESTVEIRPTVLEVTRRYGKVDVEVFAGEALAAKSILVAQLIEHES